jgi:cellulose synthase/poly-beta-1,6-N-acetylglucosamine synthase-like glycosyltransferase
MSRQETLSATEDDLDPARGPSLSIVVTLFDEAGTLEELHRRLTAALEAVDRSYEVLYVDDGSTDGSFALLERLHDDDPHIRAVRLKRNAGQHPAMHAGLSPGGRPAARGGGRRGLRRRERPSRRAARLVGSDASVASDQRDAAPFHGRRDLGLRLRLQRVPA